jgi:glycosyltransferase involved in cell wall biosynthesis
VAFVTPTNLRVGKGIEQTLLSLLKFRPRNAVELLLVQTDYIDFERVDSSFVDSLLKDVDVHRIDLPYNQFLPFKRIPFCTPVIYGIVIPLLTYFTTFKSNRTVSRLLDGVDIVVLMNNAFYPLVRSRRPLVIGTSHSIPRAGRTARFAAAFIRTGLVQRRIDGYHLHFPPSTVYGRKYDFVLPSGVDTNEYFPGEDRQDHCTRFLYVGAIEPAKGIPVLLGAWSRIPHDHVELHIAGRGSLENAVRATKGVFFHGALSSAALGLLYRSCDVLVFPSEGESFGLVVVEALASGLRILASDRIRGNFDELERLQYLRYVPNNEKQFANEMLRAAGESGRTTAQRREAFDYARKNYDWATISASFYAHLGESVAKQRNALDRR